ncbi:hypothetical protein [Pseudorhodoplanes sp.]|uniref:hypothetical protein n=1 Tax=Pseudorhodoplanes sp. TaxID=1934341 RepID=UPI002C615D65|nr:hypothetical protein [Pseudorhodoplanes sp.]HWV40185.1 hypothetical protein [Pseudorhodoplanes sp.]
MPVLHVVHCIDTEGPLTETLEATFGRLRSAFAIDLPPSRETLRRLQNCEIDLAGREEAVARMLSPELLAYNSSWDDIRVMLDDAMSPDFRRKMVDGRGGGWVYSWHCMDHMYYAENPRSKDVGYGHVFRFYREMIAKTRSPDELNWHFHPRSITGYPLHAATSFVNSYELLTEILCRRILEDGWFPVVNRPGFHAERPDSHAFLEQWIPFDYANQVHEDEVDQPDLAGGRFGDWRRAPHSWRGYRPHHDDYQVEGHCRRVIFRCLNVGTRLRSLLPHHVRQAFVEARDHGVAILSFADHDYRDIRPDVEAVRSMLRDAMGDFRDVELRFSGAEAAARDLLGVADAPMPELIIRRDGARVEVELKSGQIFGPQPFLALKLVDGCYRHDNLDLQTPGKAWSYILDDQTMPPDQVSEVAVGAAGRHGGFSVAKLKLA